MNQDIRHYADNCPLCKSEAGEPWRSAPEELSLKNFHDTPVAADASQKPMRLSLLLLKTAQGDWLAGLKANIFAWYDSPRRYFWRLRHWLVIRLLSAGVHDVWFHRLNKQLAYSQKAQSVRQSP